MARVYHLAYEQGAGGLPEMAAIMRGDQDKGGENVVLHSFRERRNHFDAIESKAARGVELPCDLFVDVGKLVKLTVVAARQHD